MSLLTVLIMALLLGVGSFTVGMLPLSFVFSKTQLARLSALGTGLLLGTSLGVIIPEGIETLAASSGSEFPTTATALSLLSGFTFMLIFEQLMSPHSYSPQGTNKQSNVSLHPIPRPRASNDFDAASLDLEHEQGARVGYMQVDLSTPLEDFQSQKTAAPLTLGLVMHGLADGLALGVSALSSSSNPSASVDLSLVVFFALIIHKAPTVLALTTSLLATSLSRTQCRKHLALFSASTPFGAIVTYVVFSTFLGGVSTSGEGRWTGIALLVSGGTFLYVATVLQPVSHHSGPRIVDEMKELTRVSLVAGGIFLPFIIGALIGHGHEHEKGPDSGEHISLG